MHGLDLNLLAALDALLQEGSVVGAARRCAITPPAMSRALGRLRLVLGDPLLVKAGRGMVPTPRAVAIGARVHQALVDAHAALSPEAAVHPHAWVRRFTIRCDDAVTALLAPRVLSVCAENAPGVTIVFVPEGSESAEALRDGSVDLDIGVQGALPPEVMHQKLFDDDRVILYGGTKTRRFGWRELARSAHVDVSRRGQARGPVDDVLARRGLGRRVVAVVPNQLAAACVVARSSAVSLVSRRFAQAIGTTMPVSWAPVPSSLGRVAVAMAWHPRFTQEPVHRWLRDHVRHLARVAAHPAERRDL